MYAAILLVLAAGVYVYYTNEPLFQTFYDTGVAFGRAALVLLGIVVLPGILGRFGIEIKITRIITLFRRQLGITVFLLAFVHYQLVRALLYYTGKLDFSSSRPLFENFGFYGLMFLFFLFLTSNNFSVKKLGKWWRRLHRFVYLILWLVVLHTVLQGISIWSVLILVFAVLEIASLIYARFKTKPEAQAAKIV